MTSVTTGMPCLWPTSRRICRPSSPRPWKLYGLVRGLKAPPRRMLAPAALTLPAIVVQDLAALDGARPGDHGQVRRRRSCTWPHRSTTVSVLVKLPAGQLERLEDRQHLLDAGDGRQRLGLQLVSRRR